MSRRLSSSGQGSASDPDSPPPTACPPADRETAWRWLVLVLAVPVSVHLPELLGLVSSDPLPLVSGLATGQGSGLLSGQPGWIDGNAGATTQALGRLVARDWLHGIVPWWNPYAGIGMPLAGEYQPAAFFLPFVLLLALPNGVLLLKFALQLVAGAGGWGLGRRLGFAPPIAAMAGLLFGCDGSFAWASDAPIQPIAFLPAILWSIEHARRQEGGWTQGWLPLGLSLGFALLAGFPEIAYLDGLLAVGWALLRLGTDGAGRRGRLSLRLLCGVLFALCLAAPQLVAFADFLPDAFLGSHAGTEQASLSGPGLALWLMPVLAGPVFFGGQWLLWFSIGGYLGAAPVLLALLGFCTKRGPDRQAGLRMLLAVWIVLIAGLAAGVWPFVALRRVVPFLGHVLVSRYATGSLSLALILLACFALQDWSVRGCSRRRRFGASLAFYAVLAVCLVLSRPVTDAISGLPGARAWRVLSLGLALLATTATIWLAGGRPGRRRLHGIVAIAATEATLLFCVPLLSAAPPTARIDTGTVDYLRRHLGTQRFTTLGGVLNPNYGAFWGIAAINHNAIPLPRRWTDHVRDAIDGAVDPIQFYGSDGPDAAGRARREEALLAHLPALRSLGVAYLVQDRGSPTLADPAVTRRDRVDAGYATLVAGAALTARYAPAGGPPQVGSLLVQVGTFRGAASGLLRARLCDRAACAQGSARLDGAADNAPLRISLDRTVSLASGGDLIVSHPDGRPVAVALWRTQAGQVPQLWLGPEQPPVLVRRGMVADIYALPAAAPYAEAPGCTLAIRSRTEMAADCAADASLLRRELFLPGWRVRVEGPGVPSWRPWRPWRPWRAWRAVRPGGTGPEAGLFQSVMLPAGHWRIRFGYAPPHAWIGWLGLGLAGAMAASSRSLARTGRQRRRNSV